MRVSKSKATARSWWAEPMAGDIVWCLFPQELGVMPAQKPRPALVLQVFDDEAPRFRVRVAYGTSQKVDALRAGEFAIRQSDASTYHFAGLAFDTKFNLGQAVDLDFDSIWFKPPPHAPFGQQPKLGALHPALVKRAAAAWQAVQ
jgi:hypothetical protein